MVGDKVNLKFGDPAIQSCFDEGRTFHFDRHACVAIRKSAFECNWANLKAEMAKKTLNSPVVDQAAASGTAKLVSCGQSQDTNRIVAQWVDIPAGTTDCSYNAGMKITTGCYTLYVGSTPPATAATPEEKAAQVYACLDQL